MINRMKCFMLSVAFLTVCGASRLHLIEYAARFGPNLDKLEHSVGSGQTQPIYDSRHFRMLAGSGEGNAAITYMTESLFLSLQVEGSLVSQVLLDLLHSWEPGAADLCKRLQAEASYFCYDMSRLLSILGGSIYVHHPKLTQKHYVKIAEAHLRAKHALCQQIPEELAVKICALSESEREAIADLPMRINWWEAIDEKINAMFKTKVLAELPELAVNDLVEGISNLGLSMDEAEKLINYLKGDTSLSGILLLDLVENNIGKETIMEYFERLDDGPILNDSYRRVSYMIYKDHHQELHLNYVKRKLAYLRYYRIKTFGLGGREFVPRTVELPQEDVERICQLGSASSLSWGHIPDDALKDVMALSLKPLMSPIALELSKLEVVKHSGSYLIEYAELFGPNLEYRGPVMDASGKVICEAWNSEFATINHTGLEGWDYIFQSFRGALEDVGSELTQTYLQLIHSEAVDRATFFKVYYRVFVYDPSATCKLSRVAGMLYLERSGPLHKEYAKVVQRRIGRENSHRQLLKGSGFKNTCKLSEEELEEFSRMPPMMNWWTAVEQRIDEMFTEKVRAIGTLVMVDEMYREYPKFMLYLGERITLSGVVFFKFVEENISREMIMGLFEKVNDDIILDDTYRTIARMIYGVEYERIHIAYAKQKIRHLASSNKGLIPKCRNYILTSEQESFIFALPLSKSQLWWLPIDDTLSLFLDVEISRKAAVGEDGRTAD